MAVKSPLQGTGEKGIVLKDIFEFAIDHHLVSDILRLVVLWAGEGLNRFPTNNTKD
jgi:hypothetical protein